MPRVVRVATVSWYSNEGIPGSHEGNRREMEAHLARAALEQPDIVLLPEAFGVAGLPVEEYAAHAEPIPGPSTEMCARYAREQGMYVICPLYERAEEGVHNTAVVLGRDGAVVGKYRKRHPTLPELEIGVRPGQEAGVLDLDFGRIGLMICFDVFYPYTARELGAAGVEIIFWASVYAGGFPLRMCAYENRCFVVSSQNRACGCIIDRAGRVVAESGTYRNLVAADVDLEETVFCTDFNAGLLDAIKRKYGREVHVTMLHDEGVFTLRSLRAEVTVAQIIEEFGLEPLDDYLRRSASHPAMGQ